MSITFNRAFGFLLDTDQDGYKDSSDTEPDTLKGYPVDRYGVSLDTDRDGFPDGRDKQ